MPYWMNVWKKEKAGKVKRKCEIQLESTSENCLQKRENAGKMGGQRDEKLVDKGGGHHFRKSGGRIWFIDQNIKPVVIRAERGII
jgi:hypothetical protein